MREILIPAGEYERWKREVERKCFACQSCDQVQRDGAGAYVKDFTRAGLCARREPIVRLTLR